MKKLSSCLPHQIHLVVVIARDQKMAARIGQYLPLGLKGIFNEVQSLDPAIMFSELSNKNCSLCCCHARQRKNENGILKTNIH